MKVHSKLEFTDTALVEKLDLADITAKTALRCLVIWNIVADTFGGIFAPKVSVK